MRHVTLLTVFLPIIVAAVPPHTHSTVIQQNIDDIFNIFNKTQEVDLTPGNRLNGDMSIISKEVPCETEDKEEGVCVLFYQCDVKTYTVKTGGEELFDLREKTCPDYYICCRLNKIRNTTQTPPKKTTPTFTTNPGCGWSNAGAMDFRLQGDNYNVTHAEFGEYPWMVALLRRTEEGAAWSQSDYLGGGSIIHPSVVVTVAHKVENKKPQELKCRAGEWDTQSTLEAYPHQERNVKKIIIHEEYKTRTKYNDIALLFLEKPYDFVNAPHMGVACLGRQMPTPGTKCFSMGWGKQSFDNSSFPVILKKVRLSSVSRDDCQASLRNTRLGMYYILDPSLTCAGGKKNEDTCTGDGGSSLVCPISSSSTYGSRFAVYGMVAYGIGCGDNGIPGVYADVPYLYDWVDKNMAAEGYNVSSYKF